MIANGDRPVVQEGPSEDTIEIIFADGDSKVLDETVAVAMFGEAMRIVTGESVGQPS